MSEEQAVQKKYDMPFAWPFSLTLAGIFLIVIANYWEYIFSIYGSSLAQFLGMVFPGFIFIGFLSLVRLEHIPRREEIFRRNNRVE